MNGRIEPSVDHGLRGVEIDLLGSERREWLELRNGALSAAPHFPDVLDLPIRAPISDSFVVEGDVRPRADCSNEVQAMRTTVNGDAVELPVDPRVSLLDFLRETLALPGTKKGCDQGACGACTVLVDGQRILSCLSLAVQNEGRSILTIEGLGRPDALHPLQQAFIDHDGFQCGYCTPGQICSAIGMAEEIGRGVPSHVTQDLAGGAIPYTREEIRERMSGNLCRCGAHNGIIAAITATLSTHTAPATMDAVE